jgi:poly(hydroxyalkanoate) depolymerase family esterase
MSIVSLRDLVEATRQTRAGRLVGATALIQRALRGSTAVPDEAPPTGSIAEPGMIDAPALAPKPGVMRSFIDWGARHLFDVAPPAGTQAAGASGAQFLSASFTNHVGTRPYKLYIPGSCCGDAVPLIVMLHGCTQSPDDFAAGTRMNAAAEEFGCLVAYPGQVTSANHSKCWNWFSIADQARDRGEPALIAGIAREVMARYAVDPSRVYIAGLSAGGAAATIMGSAYPDLFAAIGVHSGLACGAAHDLPSALAAMRQGQSTPHRRDTKGAGELYRVVPTIVFHGDRDTTVHPLNGDCVIAHAASGSSLERRVTRGSVPGGHAYSVTSHFGSNGKIVLEQWVVHGAGHTWSGGSAAGSYTDPQGPDATREMLRFFLQHENEGA